MNLALTAQGPVFAFNTFGLGTPSLLFLLVKFKNT